MGYSSVADITGLSSFV